VLAASGCVHLYTSLSSQPRVIFQFISDNLRLRHLTDTINICLYQAFLFFTSTSSWPQLQLDLLCFYQWTIIYINTFLYILFQMKPTTCTLLLSIFISTSVHVSGNYVPIIKRTYCIYVTLVFFVLCVWLSGLLHLKKIIQGCTVNKTKKASENFS
jgi:hypothetical protein